MIKNKLKNEGAMYIVFGVLTTLINIAVYAALNFFGVQYVINNTISFLVSVTFAFITNKIYVFGSKSWEKRFLFQQISKFMASRLGMFVVEIGLMLLLVELFLVNDFVSKCIVNVVVIIGNYILSKLVVFKNK